MTEIQSVPGDLATKTVRGSAYSIAASAVTLVLGLGRSILMARLLAPEDFGVVAFALTFLNLTTPLRDFGLDQALIHRKSDAESSLDEALAVHFSLRLILMGLFVLLLLAAVPVLGHFYPQKTLLVSVLLALTVGEVATALSATPTSYLRKEMRFRELAVLQVLTSLSMTVVGPLMAWLGWGVWAIVGERISGVLIAAFVVWFVIRPWPARWKLDWELTRWYLSYGKYLFISKTLSPITEQFDDFWVGATLGARSLGFYSKAYEFAQYARRIISDPVVDIFFSTFAKVQDDKARLSKAYFRVSSLIVRVGFLFVGAFILGAPEFVCLFLGTKWLPMVLTFQLMTVYTLLSPLLSITGNLTGATGHPEFNTRTRIAQVIFFVPAVIFGSRWGAVNGVAIATDMMLLMGLALILYQARALVNLSFRRMLLLPSIALLLAALASWQLSILAPDRDVIQLLVKVAGYGICYSLILLIVERDEYLTHVRLLCSRSLKLD